MRIGNKIGIPFSSRGSSSPQITNVVVTPITGGNRITWTSVSGRQTEIWASIDGGAYNLLTTQNIGVETYDHTGLYAEIVDYKLRSKLITLDAPLSLAVAIITGGLRLTWDDNNTDATHIEIYADIAGAGYSLLTTVEDGVETYDHSISDDEVYYKIRAKNTEFFSGYSNEISETAPAPPYDADALALVARMTALGETPDAARIQILSDAFTLGKTKAFWAKLDTCWLLASHGTLSSRLNILADDHNCTKESNPTYEADRGWSGDNSNYLHTDYNPSVDGVNYTLDSASIGVYSRTNNGAAGSLIGPTTGGCSYIQKYTDGHLYCQINSTQYADVASPGSIANLLVGNRTSSTSLSVYVGTTKTTQAKGSSAIANVEQLLLKLSANQISLAFAGGALTDQDVADIITVFVDGYLASIGAKV